MSRFYPQAAMTLRIIFEDYKREAADDTEPKTLNILPSSVEVQINDYRTADTFSAEVEYRAFPFDPRTIRSMGVTIHMQDMGEIASGDDRMKLTAENTVFIGFADESTIELDEDSRTVKFSGRDQTALFIDAPWDGSLVKLDGVKVDEAIKRVVKRLKSASKIEVKDRTGKPLPVLSGLAGGELGGQRNASENETYWDVIQDIAGRAGLICYMEIDHIILTIPNAMYKREQAAQFIYGRNISELNMTRKIGRMKDTNIKVLSLNPRLSPPVIEAYIPKDATPSFRKRLKLPADHLKVDKVKTSKKKEKAETEKAPDKDEREIAPFVTFRIPHARSKAQLVTIGEEIFETMSRQQIEGKFSTREMAVRDGNGIEIDVLKIRIGAPMEIRIDNDDITGIRDIDSTQDRVSYLLRRGYDAEVAKVLADSIGGFGSPFFTKSATFKVTGDGGFTLDVDFINFIELREDLLKGGA